MALHLTTDVAAAYEAWLAARPGGWWDDAGDAGGILDALQDAYEAGWQACAHEIDATVARISATLSAPPPARPAKTREYCTEHDQPLDWCARGVEGVVPHA